MNFKQLCLAIDTDIKTILGKVKPEILTGLQVAIKVTSAIEAWVATPEGKTIEAVIASVIPNGAAYEATALTLCEALGNAAAKCAGSTLAQKAILNALGAELLLIVEGKDKIGSWSEALTHFEAALEA